VVVVLEDEMEDGTVCETNVTDHVPNSIALPSPQPVLFTSQQPSPKDCNDNVIAGRSFGANRAMLANYL